MSVATADTCGRAIGRALYAAPAAIRYPYPSGARRGRHEGPRLLRRGRCRPGAALGARCQPVSLAVPEVVAAPMEPHDLIGVPIHHGCPVVRANHVATG